jgi:hypothetical protein
MLDSRFHEVLAPLKKLFSLYCGLGIWSDQMKVPARTVHAARILLTSFNFLALAD